MVLSDKLFVLCGRIITRRVHYNCLGTALPLWAGGSSLSLYHNTMSAPLAVAEVRICSDMQVLGISRELTLQSFIPGTWADMMRHSFSARYDLTLSKVLLLLGVPSSQEYEKSFKAVSIFQVWMHTYLTLKIKGNTLSFARFAPYWPALSCHLFHLLMVEENKISTDQVKWAYS